MTTVLIQFLIAAVAVTIGGIGLSRGAEAISRQFGIGQLLGGAILIAVATSLPDLVVGITAAKAGLPNLTVGDLLGAALINMLILAVMDLRHSSRGRLLSQAAAAHALSGTMCITLLAISGMSLILPDRLNFTIGGIGIGLWAVVVAYVLGLRLVFFDQRYAAARVDSAQEPDASKSGRWRGVVVYSVAALIVLFAGPQVAHSADRLAELTGLGNTFVGTAVLPLCTTLPEFVAAITGMRMRAFDLVVGNAFGTISFNLLLLAPVDFFYQGSLMADSSSTHTVTALAAILTISVAIMGQLYHAEKRRRIVEPDAILVILLVCGALGLVYLLR